MPAQPRLSTYQWQVVTGDTGEVVVFHVVTHIEGDPIEGSIVGVSLVALQEHIMLSHKVTRDRVQAQTQEAAASEGSVIKHTVVGYWFPPKPSP